ncbi:uncharacterized protein LOC129005807 [Macrosteles quadrilineatus]|uniref:uncharacterized protein LOC129005807 n=1 Tax=Macrosteles quadrilineatus TaxID=74068 RepID=UPI0023E172B6|nr:uncharacterized protein LOC129005807 [Macrosteles quadrilineatus]
MSPKNKLNLLNNISSEEFLKAEKIVFILIQKESFPEGIKSQELSGVHKFVDEDGVIRMKTRLSDREEGFEYQYPAILPSKHPAVEKIIRQNHLQNKHAGVQALIVILRDRVWILKGRRAVGKVVHNCVRCKRHIAKTLEMPSPPLPTDRTQISSCLQVCGIDLARPLITRDILEVLGGNIYMCRVSCSPLRSHTIPRHRSLHKSLTTVYS